MSKQQHASSGGTGFAAVVVVSGFCFGAMAACAAGVAPSRAVAGPAKKQPDASSGGVNLPSRKRMDAVGEPANGRAESEGALRSAATTGGTEDRIEGLTVKALHDN